MAAEAAAFAAPAIRRSSQDIARFFNDPPSFSGMVFGLPDEHDLPLENFSDESLDARELVDDEEIEDSEEIKAFWNEKEKLLRATLFRTTSIETRIRHATKEALRESKILERGHCGCRREAAAGGCRDCLRKEIFDYLCRRGFSCYVRESKWKGSNRIPAGEHTFLEVVEKQRLDDGEVRVIIELNFKAEFEMARASTEYDRLINWLPEVYVGKPERLRDLIKILCGAAKKCMEENKMHMAPWRKHKYMQAKWLLGTWELSAATAAPLLPVGFSQRPPKPTTSMLTDILIQNLSASRRQVTGVV
ncbi:hypothetical protein Nepgr_013938 [Nepenthes gracilis]|uniref:Uncharacterized protein n=1 Tax=Nepenthes gracilis TaxID=150966 RepID=A0AAD3SJ87_NEPGR|nr:hypothetical protein Nepgr_013938 [Nepenthes gracilis]